MMSERVDKGGVELGSFAPPTSWQSLVGGVDEDNEASSADRLCQLGCQLVERKNLNRGILQQFGEMPGSLPTKTIVGPQRVAVSDDQYATQINSF
jgi:hypothetical protein